MKHYHSFISESQQSSQAEDLSQFVHSKLQFFSTYAKETRSKYNQITSQMSSKKNYMIILARLDKVLETISLHFQFLIAILTEQELEEKLKAAGEEAYKNITHRSHINLVAKDKALDIALAKLFTHLEKITEGFSRKTLTMEDKLAEIEIIASKLETFLEYFPGAITMDKDDLFVQPRTSETWQKLYRDTEFKSYVDTRDISKSIKLFCGMMTCANAVVYQIDKAEKHGKSKILAGLSGISYIASEQKAKIQASLLQANPSMDSIFTVYNLPEKGLVKELYKLLLPPIAYNNKIYLPRLFPRITKESIIKEYAEGSLNKIRGKTIFPSLSHQREEIIANIFNKDTTGERVKVRVLAPYPLTMQGGFFEKLKAKVDFLRDPKPKENFNGVIIHIHGGGFVSLSSSSHRNYLIRWAKSLNMVIFSIDYRLAPESPYPGPLDDVWQAYNWLVNYSHSMLGIPMDRVVLAGDSAGGNLVMSLTLRTIKERVRIPDGCLLAYPALNLYPKTFVPSYFKALDDILLPYSMLKLCLKAYIPEGCDPKIDPFLSPIVASDELLSKLPAIRIITGTDDPLHDDNWKFLDRLQNLKRDVKMTVYEGVPHGFFSIDDLAAYELVVAESVGRIRELFYSVDKRH